MRDSIGLFMLVSDEVNYNTSIMLMPGSIARERNSGIGIKRH